MQTSKFYIFGFSLVLLLSFLSYGQERVRKIEKRTSKNEPIELVSSEVGNKTFNAENQVLADKNWLKNLKLKVKNITNKTIIFIDAKLRVEKQGKMQHPLGLPMIFGQIPPPENNDAVNLEKLKPNESTEISIIPYILEHFTTKFMPENEVVDIDRTMLYFDFVVFDDGTAWSKGQLMRRNSNNKWQDIRDEAKEIGLFKFGLNKSLMLKDNWQENRVAYLGLTNPVFWGELSNTKNSFKNK